MNNSNTAVVSAALRRDVTHGLRSQCAFLLDAISRADATPAERSVALLALLADSDRFAPVLTTGEAAALGRVVTTATTEAAARGSEPIVVLPSDEPGDPNIEGTSVRCAVVSPGSTLDVAILDLDAGHHQASSELTADGDVEGRVELVVDGVVVDSAAVGSGPVAVSESDFTLAHPVRAVLRIVNESTSESLRWFQSVLVRDDAPGDRSSQIAARELTALRSGDPASVFTPPTGEPMRIADVDRLLSLHQRFSGERIFVMGNGPSLNKTPLHLLKNDYVFAVNRISLLFERIDWRPTFYTAFDVRVVPDNAEEFADLDLEYKFFSSRYKQLLGERSNHYWYHTKGFYEGFGSGFEPTVPYSGFGGGGTIGVMAIQLAWYLGFREIYLIGTDVSYSVPKTALQSGEDEFGDGVKLELTSTEDDDANHFDPRYFGKDKKWHNPNVRDMKIGFGRAGRNIADRGGVLRNATVGGELESVERVDFESLF